MLFDDTSGEPSRSWVASHEAELWEVDPITAIVSPEVAIRVMARGGCVVLSAHNGSDWHLQADALTRLASMDMEAARRVARENQQHLIRGISRLQSIDCGEIVRFLDVLEAIDGGLVSEALRQVDVSEAEKSWGARIRERKADCVRAASKLIRLALECEGEISDVARRLSARIPSRFRIDQ